VITFAVSATPGIVFFVLASVFQILNALDFRPPTGDSVLPFIAVGFFWVFLGPIVIPLGSIVGWFAVRRADPMLRAWWFVCTMLAIGGWMMMAEFMRMS
jgi:hypothetical protein